MLAEIVMTVVETLCGASHCFFSEMKAKTKSERRKHRAKRKIAKAKATSEKDMKVSMEPPPENVVLKVGC
ncbi:hypothetical protein VNO78_01615 [Psophocarpus tetragonolobus]|uniref:Uncharacterized protein n=1 Tax=Psophocarpus tetragonolobus TaxID=3891 RepID=A0AAN9XUQ9_PSOTE